MNVPVSSGSVMPDAVNVLGKIVCKPLSYSDVIESALASGMSYS